MNKLDKNGLIANEVHTDSLKIGGGILVDENNNLKWNDSEIITSNGGTITANGLYLNSCNLNINGNIYSDSEKKVFDIGYSYSEKSGSLIALRGINNETEPGSFAFIATDGSNYTYLKGYPNGDLTWNNDLTFRCPSSANLVEIGTTKNHTNLIIGLGNGRGGSFQLNDNQYYQYEEGGAFVLNALDKNGNMKSLMGSPSGSLTWGGNTVVTTNFKNHINWDSDMTSDPYFGFNNSKVAGPYMYFRRGNSTTNAGSLELVTRLEGGDAVDTSCALVLKPDKTITWGGSKVYTANNFTGGASTIATSNLTASRALISNSSGKVAVSAVTSTELGYLDGVTSNVQTQLNSKIDLKPGAIIAMAADATPGSGWLVCQGQEVSRTTYATLWNAIGTKYGAGNGSTTFNLPSLINRVIMGTWSNTFGTLVESGLPNISGTIQTRSSNGSSYGVLVDGSGPFSKGGIQSGSGTGGVLTVSSTSKNADIISFDASKSNSIYGKSSIVQPPALLIRYYIKY